MRSSIPVPADLAPELCVYRTHTANLLRRYFRMSIELGRLPTVLGREFFRARVTSYKMQSFEDAVIFVHDVERCLQQLDPVSQEVIARVVLQEHSYDEAAALFGWPRRTLARTVLQALDQLTEMFLAGRLIEPYGFIPKSGNTCQEGKNAKIRACA